MPTYHKYSYNLHQAGDVAINLPQQGLLRHKLSQLSWWLLTLTSMILIFVANSCVAWKAVALDLPSSMELSSPEDIPEEVARTEIITEARSSLDGSPISAVEYAEEQTSLRTAPYAPDVSQRLRDLVILLQVRRLLRPFLP